MGAKNGKKIRPAGSKNQKWPFWGSPAIIFGDIALNLAYFFEIYLSRRLRGAVDKLKSRFNGFFQKLSADLFI